MFNEENCYFSYVQFLLYHFIQCLSFIVKALQNGEVSAAFSENSDLAVSSVVFVKVINTVWIYSKGKLI